MQEVLGGSMHPASRDTCTCSFPPGSWAGTGLMGLNEWRGTGHWPQQLHYKQV